MINSTLKNTSIARILRKHSTDVERIIWQKLRSKQLNNHKFRRQQPIGNYIVDFVCFKNRLIIELDGGQHAIDRDKDIERDRWLTEHGFSVLRFWNNDVLENLNGVLERILEELERSPSPLPPPIKGGE